MPRVFTRAMGTSAERLRWALAATATAGLLVGASGLTQKELFSRPTDLKYGLTVAAPLFLVAVFTASEPLLVIIAAIVVAGPFAGLSASFAGIAVSPLVPLIGAAAAIAVGTGPRPGRLSSVGWAVIPALVLFAVPFWEGITHSRYVVLFGSMIIVGWLVARAASLPGGLRLVAWSLVASATIQAAFAIWQFRTGNLLNLYSGAGNHDFGSSYFFTFGTENRPTGSLYDPISLGNILALACPLALVLSATARTTTARLLASVAMLLIGIALTLSLSRMSWIGAVAGLILAILLLPSRHRPHAVMTVLALAVVVLFIPLGFVHGSLDQRFSSIFHPTSKSVRTAEGDRQRIAVWRAGLERPRHTRSPASVSESIPPAPVGPGARAERNRRTLSRPTCRCSAKRGLQVAWRYYSCLAASGAILPMALRQERALYAGLAGRASLRADNLANGLHSALRRAGHDSRSSLRDDRITRRPASRMTSRRPAGSVLSQQLAGFIMVLAGWPSDRPGDELDRDGDHRQIARRRGTSVSSPRHSLHIGLPLLRVTSASASCSAATWPRIRTVGAGCFALHIGSEFSGLSHRLRRWWYSACQRHYIDAWTRTPRARSKSCRRRSQRRRQVFLALYETRRLAAIDLIVNAVQLGAIVVIAALGGARSRWRSRSVRARSRMTRSWRSRRFASSIRFEPRARIVWPFSGVRCRSGSSRSCRACISRWTSSCWAGSSAAPSSVPTLLRRRCCRCSSSCP